MPDFQRFLFAALMDTSTSAFSATDSFVQHTTGDSSANALNDDGSCAHKLNHDGAASPGDLMPSQVMSGGVWGTMADDGPFH